MAGVEELKPVLKKRSKPKAKALTPEQAKLRTQLLEQGQVKLAREQKVLEAIESLFAPSIDIDALEAAGSWICLKDYKDAIKERTHQGMCGYPLCAKKLEEVDGFGGTGARHKYLIKERRTDGAKGRKYFCSDGCFRASGIFSGSLPEYRPIRDPFEDWGKEQGSGEEEAEETQTPHGSKNPPEDKPQAHGTHRNRDRSFILIPEPNQQPPKPLMLNLFRINPSPSHSTTIDRQLSEPKPRNTRPWTQDQRLTPDTKS
mmetsp:Transcript_3070/g.4961  ORF Transcript_3070/g.4961 Transcript_3070/m.4961 type:complete len:258 (+) Transcript_3070:277-1050(+)